MIITLAVAVLLSSIKNPTKKAALRDKVLEVFNAIRIAYADDPEFM